MRNYASSRKMIDRLCLVRTCKRPQCSQKKLELEATPTPGTDELIDKMEVVMSRRSMLLLLLLLLLCGFAACSKDKDDDPDESPLQFRQYYGVK